MDWIGCLDISKSIKNKILEPSIIETRNIQPREISYSLGLDKNKAVARSRIGSLWFN
jgi:hypothetical protein